MRCLRSQRSCLPNDTRISDSIKFRTGLDVLRRLHSAQMFKQDPVLLILSRS